MVRFWGDNSLCGWRRVLAAPSRCKTRLGRNSVLERLCVYIYVHGYPSTTLNYSNPGDFLWSRSHLVWFKIASGRRHGWGGAGAHFAAGGALGAEPPAAVGAGHVALAVGGFNGQRWRGSVVDHGWTWLDHKCCFNTFWWEVSRKTNMKWWFSGIITLGRGNHPQLAGRMFSQIIVKGAWGVSR